MEYIAIAFSLVAVILCLVILTKVNKLLTMLRTPIFKKLTPDMNLKPSSRRPISAAEMQQRGERKDLRPNQNTSKDKFVKDNRSQQPQQSRERSERDFRNDQRNNNRQVRRPGSFHHDSEQQAAPVAPASQAPVAPQAPIPAQVDASPVAERRPLAPRIPVETPAAPVANVQAPVDAKVEAAEAAFEPAKVRYGRRNVIKKAPELLDDEV